MWGDLPARIEAWVSWVDGLRLCPLREIPAGARLGNNLIPPLLPGAHAAAACGSAGTEKLRVAGGCSESYRGWKLRVRLQREADPSSHRRHSARAPALRPLPVSASVILAGTAPTRRKKRQGRNRGGGLQDI